LQTSDVKVYGVRSDNSGSQGFSEATLSLQLFLFPTASARRIDFGWNDVRASLALAPRALFYVGGDATTTFEDIRFHDSIATQLAEVGFDVLGAGVGDVRIYNNVVTSFDITSGTTASVFATGVQGPIYLDHNTFVEQGIVDGTPPVGAPCQLASSASQAGAIFMVNNVFQQTARSPAHFFGATDVYTIDNNLWSVTAGIPSSDLRAIAGPALFGATGALDFSLTGGAGVDVARESFVTTDFSGLRRPQGPSGDVGAFEHVP
jgi:hypothetical protein